MLTLSVCDVQMALYFALGAIGFSMLVYNVSRPGENGDTSALRRWINKTINDGIPKWEVRNTLRTDVLEQAAQDKNLFKTVAKRDMTYRTPEYVPRTAAATWSFEPVLLLLLLTFHQASPVRVPQQCSCWP